MYRHNFLFIIIICFFLPGRAQISYDSITISYFKGEQILGTASVMNADWPDTLKQGKYKNWLLSEKTIYIKKDKKIGDPYSILLLSHRIRTNGTADISQCFIPRHSINYYIKGTIDRFLLICFECDGLLFSREPKHRFVKSINARDRQIEELKTLFKNFAIFKHPDTTRREITRWGIEIS